MQDLRQLENCFADWISPGSAGLGALLRPTATLPRQQRQLPERILAAVHQACDIGELETAARLLSVLDTMLAQTAGSSATPQRRVVTGMVAAYERLWHLRRAIGPLA